jgi:hypothetical protein
MPKSSPHLPEGYSVAGGSAVAAFVGAVAFGKWHCDCVEPHPGQARAPSDSRAVPRFDEHAEIPAADPAHIGSTTPYRLAASVSGLGARVTPEHRLGVAVRRPMAELVAATGVAVGLSAAIGGQVVFLNRLDLYPAPGLPDSAGRRRRGHRNRLPCTECGRRYRCGRSGLCRDCGSARHWTTGGGVRAYRRGPPVALVDRRHRGSRRPDRRIASMCDRPGRPRSSENPPLSGGWGAGGGAAFLASQDMTASSGPPPVTNADFSVHGARVSPDRSLAASRTNDPWLQLFWHRWRPHGSLTRADLSRRGSCAPHARRAATQNGPAGALRCGALIRDRWS